MADKTNLNMLKFQEALNRAKKTGSPVPAQSSASGRKLPGAGVKVNKYQPVQKGRALLIEPDRRSAVLLQNQLKMLKLDVTHFDVGKRAIQAVEKECPKIILIAKEMSDISGKALCSRIRTISGADAVPILIFTDNPAEATKDAALMIGATNAICKPFKIPDLMETLREMLGIE